MKKELKEFKNKLVFYLNNQNEIDALVSMLGFYMASKELNEAKEKNDILRKSSYEEYHRAMIPFWNNYNKYERDVLNYGHTLRSSALSKYRTKIKDKSFMREVEAEIKELEKEL